MYRGLIGVNWVRVSEFRVQGLGFRGYGTQTTT